MVEQLDGPVTVTRSGRDRAMIVLNGDGGTVELGGDGKDVRSASGRCRNVASLAGPRSTPHRRPRR